MASRTSDEVIKKAEEAFSLDLISEQTLNVVTRRALTEPGYNAVVELPFDWEIQHEKRLRSKALRPKWLRWLP